MTIEQEIICLVFILRQTDLKATLFYVDESSDIQSEVVQISAYFNGELKLCLYDHFYPIKEAEIFAPITGEGSTAASEQKEEFSPGNRLSVPSSKDRKAMFKRTKATSDQSMQERFHGSQMQAPDARPPIASGDHYSFTFT